MNSNGLALLGDAFASGTADYANIKREQAIHNRTRAEREADRQQEREFQLADVREARKFESEFRGAAWDHEDKLYKQRQFDAIKSELVREKLLDPKDATNPEAVSAAWKKRGPDYERQLAELAAYKAAIPGIMKSAKGRVNVSAIMDMTPADIEKARELMHDAYDVVGSVVLEDAGKEEANRKNGAALLGIHLAQLAEIEGKQGKLESEQARYQSGELTDAEHKRALQMALASPLLPPGLASKANPTPSEKAALQAEIVKAEANIRFMGAQQVVKQGVNLVAQMRAATTKLAGVKAAFDSGLAGLMDLPTGPAAAAGPRSTEAAAEEEPNDDAEDFLGVKKPAAAPAAPADANAYGGPLGLAISAGHGIAKVPGVIDRMVAAVPNALDTMVGGKRFAREGQSYSDRARAAQSVREPLPFSGGKTYGPAGPAAPIPAQQANSIFGDSSAQRDAEERILTMAPYSMEAIEIRRRRGITAPAELGGDPGSLLRPFDMPQ